MKRYGQGMLLAVLLAPWAVAADLPVAKQCLCTDAVQSCSTRKQLPNNRLRALRIQDAVRNGDMTADEARRLAENPAEDFPLSFEPHQGHADRPDSPGKAERRFWREQRRRSLHPAPLPLE